MKPLTTGQLAMWYAYQLNPEQSNFITAEFVKFDKKPDVQLLQRAIQYTFEQVEVFHQQYVECEEHVFQRPQQKAITVPIIEVRDETKWMEETFHRPFALEKGDVFYTALLQNSETQETTWYLKVHHIAIDAFAYQLLYRAVATQYEALLKGNQQPLSNVFDSYEAVLEEEKQYEESTRFLEDQAFWKTYMEERQEIAAFSSKMPTLSGDVIRASTVFSVEDVQKWNKEGFLRQVSPQHYFMSAFALFAYKIAHKKEVVINMPLMQRFGSKAANVPCLHMNMVPLRIQVDATKTLLEMAEVIKEQELKIKQHGTYPFEQIKREAGCHVGERICTGQLNFMPFYETIAFGECLATTHKQSIGVIDDLSLNLFGNAEGGLQCELLANADLYTTEQLTQWIGHFEQLLHENTVPAFETLKQSVLEAGAYTASEDVLSMIEQHVRNSPNAIAIQSEAGDWTYERLGYESDQMAEWLIKNRIEKQDFVALYLPRTPELISCMIAVLKIQATYIPMDPIYPKERIAYMMQDANVKAMICEQTCDFNAKQLLTEERPWASLSGNWQREAYCPEQMAYMIYTSGSTGNPKGVMIERHNLSNFLVGMQQRLPMTKDDALLAVTTNAFDISMLECFLPLSVGAKVVLTTAEQIHDPLALANWIETKNITFIQATPSLWKSLVKFIPQQLTSIVALVGGEALSESLAQSMLQTTKQVFNMYGPTETTIWSTMALITDAHDITLGQPISQTELYILDDDLQPVLDGTEGQLYIAGEGVGRGYYGRETLTAERFIANPFHHGGRMYQTGDLVKRQGEALYYVGRTDFQVKVRGFRVELVEIERALEQLPTIEEALVMLRDERLVAYYIGKSEVDQLKEILKQTLPDYMVPDDWCCLEKWPLTSNGKINRLALPKPHIEVIEEAFENEIEEQLAALYQSILHVEQVMPTSHFFQLGGHSILATSLMMAIRKQWHVDVTIATIFEYPTVRALAAVLFDANDRHSLPELEEVEETTYVPLSPAQKGMWFMQQTKPSATYNIPLLVEHFSYDLQRVRETLAILQQQHPILRTKFFTVEGVPMQRVTEDKISVTIASELDVAQHTHNVFDLEKELSLRVFAYEEGLLFLFHHIAIDGFGLSVFLEDFTFAYEHLQPRTQPKSYAAFVEWQRKLLETPKKEEGLSYWEQQLKAVSEEVSLPYDEGQSAYEGAHITHEMPQHLVRASQQLAKEQGVSLYTVLQTTFTVLLHKMGAGNDFTIGSPTVGRPLEALQEMLGLMMNTVVYRYDLDEKDTFEQLLQKIIK